MVSRVKHVFHPSIVEKREGKLSSLTPSTSCSSLPDHCDQVATSVVSIAAEDPAPLRCEAWTEASATSFDVRGSTYLKDRKKVPSKPSVFSLWTVDLVQCDNRSISLDGICRHPKERIQMALKRERETGIQELPNFIFAVNLAVPGSSIFHMVAYFAFNGDVSELTNKRTPHGRLCSKFFWGDSDEYRNKTFKIIPRIVEGNYFVKRAVGRKPSIMGRKLKINYIRGEERFFEIVVDIGSSPVAEKLTALGIGYARSLILDMMFLLEGTDEDTLPEQILGGVRLIQLDFKNRDGRRLCT